MKKLFATIFLMLITTVSYAKEYVCVGYFDGSVVGETLKVNASKLSVAEAKAKSRMKKTGIDVGYVECK